MKGFSKIFLVSIIVVLVTSLLSVTAFAQTKSVLDTLKEAKNVSVFLKAVEMADLSSTLAEGEAVTVLVPTDDVADDLKSAIDEGDTDKVYSIVSLHIISTESLTAKALADAGEVWTDGGTITVKQEGKDTVINDTIKIVKADVKAKNGIIHFIDGVILPAEEVTEEEIFEEELEEEVEEESGD